MSGRASDPGRKHDEGWAKMIKFAKTCWRRPSEDTDSGPSDTILLETICGSVGNREDGDGVWAQWTSDAVRAGGNGKEWGKRQQLTTVRSARTSSKSSAAGSLIVSVSLSLSVSLSVSL